MATRPRFLEPLEATAIGTAIVHVRSAADWIAEYGRNSGGNADEIEDFNHKLASFVCRNSLFVAWHYACGSRWHTAFWDMPATASSAPATVTLPGPHLTAMEEFVEAGRALPGLALSTCDDQDQWDREIYPLLTPLSAVRQFLRTQLRPDRSRHRLLRGVTTNASRFETRVRRETSCPSFRGSRSENGSTRARTLSSFARSGTVTGSPS